MYGKSCREMVAKNGRVGISVVLYTFASAAALCNVFYFALPMLVGMFIDVLPPLTGKGKTLVKSLRTRGIFQLQWNLDLTNYQGSEEMRSLYRGFVNTT